MGTHNVLCYPIRCCAIRSLERRFQEKRQSSLWRQLLRADERRFRNVQELLGWQIQLERLISERFHFLLLKFFCFLTLLRVEQKKFTSRGIEKPDPKLNIFVISERAYPAHLHLLYTCSCICCFVISIDQRY